VTEELKGDSHQIWRTQRVQVNVASLRLFLRSSTGPNRAFDPQTLGRVRDRVRIAEGQTYDFGFSILDFGLRTEATRVSLPEAPARGEGFIVDSARGHPLSGTWETWMAPNAMPASRFDLAVISRHLRAGGGFPGIPVSRKPVKRPTASNGTPATGFLADSRYHLAGLWIVPLESVSVTGN